MRCTGTFRALLLAGLAAAAAAAVNVTIDLNQKRPIGNLLYGIFFEEINHAGDGGLYAELVKDRSFDSAAHLPADPPHQRTPELRAARPPAHSKRPNQMLGSRHFSPNPWSTVGNAVFMLDSSNPINAGNKVYAKLAVTNGQGGLVNTGYWGIPIIAGKNYSFSTYLALHEGHVSGLSVQLLLPGQELGAAQPAGSLQLAAPRAGSGWQKASGTLMASASSSAARLVLSFTGPGTLLVDMVSLFPAENMRPGQLNPWPFRQELLGALKALQPRFVRFPGGCFVEGNDFSSSFYWNKSIGSIDARPGHLNDVWRYWSTDGLGLYEYMLLAEELGAQAVWVVNNGISHGEDVPTSKIGPWVQSALDSMEFVTGAADSKWGSVRAAMGHPEPWQLTYMAIGNEDCGHDAYLGNYLAFSNAIKAKYPHMRLISNCDLGMADLQDLWDYHQYRAADDMWDNLRNAFDTPEVRAGSHIFASEYAVVGDGWGTLQGAVAEAGFMIGMERNADVVEMASYAPLLVNANWATWLPDMIAFDNHRLFGSPSYWVQQLFSQHQGTHSLAVQAEAAGDRLVLGASCQDVGCSSLLVQVVNYDRTAKQVVVNLQDVAPEAYDNGSRSYVALKADGTWIVLTSGSPADGNSFEEPLKVAPTRKKLQLNGAAEGYFALDAAPWSVNLVLLEREQQQATV